MSEKRKLPKEAEIQLELQALGATLRQQRKSADRLTQEKAAARARELGGRLTKEGVSEWETSKRLPTFENLWRYLRANEMDPRGFFEDYLGKIDEAKAARAETLQAMSADEWSEGIRERLAREPALRDVLKEMLMDASEEEKDAMARKG